MKKGNFCPLIKKECIENKCSWYRHVRGVNPNTGAEMEEWQCAVTLLPALLIENSQQQRSTAAAVESFRNESVQRSDLMNTILMNASQMNQIEPVSVKQIPSG
jgi:hypothetical protein